MPVHDLIAECGHFEPNVFKRPWPDEIHHIHFEGSHFHVCPMKIHWGGRTAATPLPCHPSEKVLLWWHPKHGYRYPGVNNLPMPSYYRRFGFVPREIRSLREIEKFEKEQNVKNERAWFDKGSGRSFDGG